MTGNTSTSRVAVSRGSSNLMGVNLKALFSWPYDFLSSMYLNLRYWRTGRK